MKPGAARSSTRRREPVQDRAKETVRAMLDAVVKLLKRGGSPSITTNRIAETAGVSIGSVYQYFPHKQALFLALHERHLAVVDQVMGRRISDCAESSLEHLIESLVDGMVEIHTLDPELSEWLLSQVPDRAGGTSDFSIRFHGALRAALTPHRKSLGKTKDLDLRTFVVANLLEALGHAVVLRRPRGLSLARAKAESCKAILAYLAF